jgi:hypothetical protein|tara:strand:+ start:259 stop:489 length:231 start_codon:yes stop_codon:yes gene_type:complete
MFNSTTKEEKMTEENKRVWLVIEKNVFTTFNETFSVSKTSYNLTEALEYQEALEKLNDRENQSYFIASEMGEVKHD